MRRGRHSSPQISGLLARQWNRVCLWIPMGKPSTLQTTRALLLTGFTRARIASSQNCRKCLWQTAEVDVHLPQALAKKFNWCPVAPIEIRTARRVVSRRAVFRLIAMNYFSSGLILSVQNECQDITVPSHAVSQFVSSERFSEFKSHHPLSLMATDLSL